MKSKKTVIHRTTSETLRLGDSDLTNLNPVRVSVQSVSTSSRKKSQTTSPSCSFQITGVSLTRCDLGDDSADDLDESHTDDISRVTDNDTPSFSEDSRDTDDHLLQPILATSSNIPAQQNDIQWTNKENQDMGFGRFKVVKIESVAPFSRGRWTCFDYLDHSENVPKVSYVYCKQQFIRQTQSMRTTSAKDSKGSENDMIRKNQNVRETNCMYPGSSMIMPEPIFKSIPASVAQKNKAKTTAVNVANTTSTVRHIIKPNFNVNPNVNFYCRNGDKEKKIINNVISCNTTSNVISNDSSNKASNWSAPINNDVNKIATVITSKAEITQCNQLQQQQYVGASVSCTATIDTKIEHALDVVKNHLTHAVRLEVEELKIKINELVDRISYLEYENDLLRANVAPDVLATLGNGTEEK